MNIEETALYDQIKCLCLFYANSVNEHMEHEIRKKKYMQC